MTKTPKDHFLESLDRCSAVEGFIPSFYDHFLSQSEEVRAKFRFTDFEKQNEMLLRSLRLSAGATAGEPEALREMRERAETHDRHHLNITPEMYELWLDSVILTASEFDPLWNDTIKEAWHEILGFVTKHMIKYY